MAAVPDIKIICRLEFENDHFPTSVIYNNGTTVCIFEGGDKVISRPSKDDEFDPEVGLAMCIAKRVYGSRQAFLRAVANANYQKGKGDQ